MMQQASQVCGAVAVSPYIEEVWDSELLTSQLQHVMVRCAGEKAFPIKSLELRATNQTQDYLCTLPDTVLFLILNQDC